MLTILLYQLMKLLIFTGKGAGMQNKQISKVIKRKGYTTLVDSPPFVLVVQGEQKEILATGLNCLSFR